MKEPKSFPNLPIRCEGTTHQGYMSGWVVAITPMGKLVILSDSGSFIVHNFDRDDQRHWSYKLELKDGGA